MWSEIRADRHQKLSCSSSHRGRNISRVICNANYWRYCACNCAQDELETACLWLQTCCSTFYCSVWTVTPADRATTNGWCLTRRVTQSTIKIFIFRALKWLSLPRENILMTRNTDILHFVRAVWGTNAASNFVVVLRTFFVPEHGLFLAFGFVYFLTHFLFCVATPSWESFGLVAV